MLIGAHQSSKCCPGVNPLSINGFIIAGNAVSAAAMTTIASKAKTNTPKYLKE